jgi:hypothetical protein
MHIACEREFAAPARFWDSYSVFYVIFSDVLPPNTLLKRHKQTGHNMVRIPMN